MRAAFTLPLGSLTPKKKLGVPVTPAAVAAGETGQVVTKAALLDAMWADTAVSEGVLTACLRTLR
jgi:hypothetical protein